MALLDRVALADESVLTSSELDGVAVRVAGNCEWAEDVLPDADQSLWRVAANPVAAYGLNGLVVRRRAADRQARRCSRAPGGKQPNKPICRFFSAAV